MIQILYILIILENCNAVLFLQIREFKCSFSGKTLNVSFCYPKTYPRKRFTINIEVVTSRKLDLAKLNYTLYKENSMNDYEKILNLDNVKICEAVLLSENQGLLKFIVDEIKRNDLGSLIRACTETGTRRAVNVSLSDSPFIAMFPSATYKTVMELFDDFDDNILKMNFLARIFRK